MEMKSDDLENKVKELIKQANDLLSEKQFDGALHAFNEALSLDPTNSEAYRGRAACLRFKAHLSINQGNYDAAIGLFELDNRDALVPTIRSLRAEHSTGQVKQLIRAALRLYNDADMRSEFGWFYYYDGQYDEAVEYFDEALQTNENCTPAVQ